MKVFNLIIPATTIVMTILLAAEFRSQSPSEVRGAQADTKEFTEMGYRAQAIVKRAVQAAGGSDKLDAFRSISLEFDGEAAATYQSQNPENPHRMLPRTGVLVFDLSGDRLLTSSETRWPNFTMRSKVLYQAGKSLTIDDDSKSYRAADDREIHDAWALRTMPWILQRLKNDLMSAVDGGVRQINGKRYDVVLSTLGTDRIHRIYFLQTTGLPEIVENLDYSSDFGDMTVRRLFSNFVKLGGVTIPMSVTTFNNDHNVMTHIFRNVVANPADRLAALQVPSGYREAPRTGDTPKMQTRAIGKGVHLIENLAGRDYNVMFADLGDSLIVFEAPIDLWASRMVLEEIRKVYPSKPIQYVMVTHFHDDHAAGLRTYIAEGMTVITTPGNQRYFEQVARLRHDFHRENALLASRSPKFELVRNGSHQIKAREFTIQLFDLGPTPHVDENLVAYIPEMGILFQGDFFRVPRDRTRPEPIRPEGKVFLERLREKGLKIKQLVGVHGPIGNLDDLQEASKTASGLTQND